MDAETKRILTLAALAKAHKLGLTRVLFKKVPDNPVSVMGLNFKNPVGLAAGMDKNGEYIDAFAAMGFGFVEIGSFTHQHQRGNPNPRLWLIEDKQAVINKMGMPNGGPNRLSHGGIKRPRNCRLGISIAFDGDLDRVTRLYKLAEGLADYVAVNASCPNVNGQPPGFEDILRLGRWFAMYKSVPVALKLSPDLGLDQYRKLGATLGHDGMYDAVIATNTSKSILGGISGAPLKQHALAAVSALANGSGGKLPIIGCGGIMSAGDASDYFNAGATLVQVYTGLVYRGQRLVKEVAKCKR